MFARVFVHFIGYLQFFQNQKKYTSHEANKNEPKSETHTGEKSVQNRVNDIYCIHRRVCWINIVIIEKDPLELIAWKIMLATNGEFWALTMKNASFFSTFLTSSDFDSCSTEFKLYKFNVVVVFFVSRLMCVCFTQFTIKYAPTSDKIDPCFQFPLKNHLIRR